MFGVALAYVVALTQFHDRLVTVLKVLGLFNLALLAVCAGSRFGGRRRQARAPETSRRIPCLQVAMAGCLPLSPTGSWHFVERGCGRLDMTTKWPTKLADQGYSLPRMRMRMAALPPALTCSTDYTNCLG